MLKTLRSGRAGFTTIEMIVVLAIIAVLAAIVGVNAARTVNSGRSAGLAESLDGLRQSIYRYRQDVRRYPRNLTDLSTQPAGGTLDLCGRTVPAAFLAEWRGPYTAQTITASGVTVGDAQVQNALEIPAVVGIETTGTLFIVVQEVDSLVAAKLEEAYDNPVAAGVYDTGVIRWSDTAPTGDRRGTLKFGLAIRGC